MFLVKVELALFRGTLSNDQQTKLVTYQTKPSPYLFRMSGSRSRGIQLGALAQLGERLICIQEVRSSILLGSTRIKAPPDSLPSEPRGLARLGDFP